jgi:single-strand DNA-binding protein
MYQKAIIIGNLGADPESRKSGDLSITNLRVATNKTTKGEKITTWWRVVCFRQAADYAATKSKGDLVMIEGEIKQSKWTDKNGVERTTLELIAATVKGLGKREASEGHSRPAPLPRNGGAVGFDDNDEIPF